MSISSVKELPDPSTDWPRILNELTGKGGMSWRQLASAVGETPSKLRRLVNEVKEPRVSLGVKLLLLHSSKVLGRSELDHTKRGAA